MLIEVSRRHIACTWLRATMTTHDGPLIEAFMPRYALRQVDRVAVAAGPHDAYAAARAIDLYRLAYVRGLVELRMVPDRLAAWHEGRSLQSQQTLSIDDITGAGSGFVLLGEETGREVVVGSVGKFWRPAIDFVSVTPDAFRGFDRAGYGKLAWCIRIEPHAGGGSWITVELRVGATDDASWAAFERYWRLIGPFSHAIRRSALRMLARELGAAPADETKQLAGDEILSEVRVQRTHVVTIEAPVERVWPWLVQMGARRAGWYSYDWLDHAGVRSADRIIAELQTLSVGDTIAALPQSPDGFAVLRIDAQRALVLGDPSLLPGGTRPAGAPPWKTTWAFVLEPIGSDATRLLVRVRAVFEPKAKLAMLVPAALLAHELMERRQLRNLRRRAESQVMS